MITLKLTDEEARQFITEVYTVSGNQILIPTLIQISRGLEQKLEEFGDD